MQFLPFFIYFSYLFLSRGGGGLIRETKVPMQELELKMQGGLMREGGRNRGILRYSLNVAKSVSVYAIYHHSQEHECSSTDGSIML